MYLDMRGYWGFYISKDWLLFLVGQVLSGLYLRNPKHGGQVIPSKRTLWFKAPLLESPNIWALFLLDPYFMQCSICNGPIQEMGLPFLWPMDIDPLGPSDQARRALFLSSSTKMPRKHLQFISKLIKMQ